LGLWAFQLTRVAAGRVFPRADLEARPRKIQCHRRSGLAAGW
jgi:hypothetical protein